MKRALRLALTSGVLAVALGALAGGSVAEAPPGGPFYLVPSVTKECTNVKDCTGVTGPWVLVPAKGEATYLFGCPKRRGFVVGGTDARASSRNVRVWFDGKLGAPIGLPSTAGRGSSALLFHAVSNNGRRGWFQPILGCVSLTQKTRRSTVSALPGTPPGAPLDLRAEDVGLRLNRELTKATTTLACPKREKLVGSWSAFAAATTDPPSLSYPAAVSIRTVVSGGKVRAAFGKDRLFGPLAPRAWAQIGAMCEP